jgi:hypothetical protein
VAVNLVTRSLTSASSPPPWVWLYVSGEEEKKWQTGKKERKREINKESHREKERK